MQKLIFIVVLLGYYLMGFAMPTNWRDHNPNLLAPTFIDGMNVDEIWIFANDQKLYIDQAQLFKILENILLENQFQKIFSLQSDKNYLDSDQLKSFGITIQFDMANLNLYLTIPLEMRKTNSIDFLATQSSRGMLITPSPFSYFLNFNYNQNYVDGISNNEQLHNELNLNFQGHIIHSGGYYTSANRKRYYREYTRYSHDLINQRARFMAGDLNHNVTDLQEQFKGLGFTLQNDFSINPTILRTNFNQYEISLKEPSIVEIYLNESRIYRAKHVPGLLNLNRLPLTIGLNEIKVIVTSDSGRSETYYYQTNYHVNLLPKSIKDYSVNVLIGSEYNDDNDLEYNDRKKYFSGYYRYGLTDSLTWGVNFQGQDKNNLAGAELSKAFSRLLLQGFYTNSYFNNENVGSYLIRFQNNPSPNNLKPIRINANYRYFDKDFTYSSGTINKTQFSQTFSSSYILNSASSFGLGLEYRKEYDGNRYEFTNLEYIYRMNVNTYFSLKAQIDNLEKENNSILFSLNWFETNQNKFSGYHSYDTEKRRSRNQLNYRNRYDSKKLLVSATHEKDNVNASEYGSLFANLDTSIGAIKVDHFEGNQQKVNNLNLQFAFVGANSRPYLSRYITNSFLIIDSTSPSLINVGNELQTSVSSEKSAVINNLSAYQNNNIPLELDQLGYGEDLSYDYLTVQPKYLSGSYLKINTDKTTSLGLKLQSDDPQKVRYQPVTLMNDKQSFETITGKRGMIFFSSIPAGTYSLFLGDKLITVIDIPDKPGYVQLGDIKVE